jgi:hypothetical protein
MSAGRAGRAGRVSRAAMSAGRAGHGSRGSRVCPIRRASQMEIREILQWVIPVVGGAVALYFVRRSMGRVSDQGAEKLARVGLQPVPGTPKGGTSFAGRYRELECGYHWGNTAKLKNRVGTRVGSVTAGSEFWVKLGFDGPPLAVVERGDKAWKPFEGTVVPRAEVTTGDPAFDQRFRVRCEDPAWAQAVLGPEARARLLQFPLLFLVQVDGQVIFPLYFDGTKLFDAMGVSMREGWGLMDRAGTFLDAAIVLVEHLSVARQA